MTFADKLNILLVTHYYADHQGGIEIAARELASRLVENNCRVVWAASAPAPPLPDGIEALPMRAWNIAERRLGFPYPIWSPRSISRLWRAVRHAEVVHLHDSLYFGNVASYMAARWMRKPVIVTQHVGDVPYRSRLLRILLKTANHTIARGVLGGCERVVFTGERVRDYFSSFVTFRRTPMLCPTGVDPEQFSPLEEVDREKTRTELGISDKRPALLFVGRFVEKKGLDLLHPLAARFRDCDWIFAGWGPLDPTNWNLPNVRVVGRLGHARLAAYYRAADVLVLPSRGEGFPLVVQEAMACGTTALITRETALGCPCVAEVASLCEPSVEDVSQALTAQLASLDMLRQRRPQVAQFAAHNWDSQRCATRYLELVRTLGVKRSGGHLPYDL